MGLVRSFFSLFGSPRATKRRQTQHARARPRRRNTQHARDRPHTRYIRGARAKSRTRRAYKMKGG